ncbi:hypothetical protein vBBceHLY2_00083 [Bacillus phage vB_BceH_LY2]|nr:hypothetical protein vBBceHLY2_00083 [Bacillus phage vB_BceH_LY2]
MNELVLEKILLAKKYLEEAEQSVLASNTRLSLGKLDEVEHEIEGAKWLLRDDIKKEEW